MQSFSRGLLFSFFLLVAGLLLCSSAATLDAEERQKEEAARASGRVDVTEGAADGAPEPPQNLLVYVIAYNSVLVTWSEPSDTSDVDHYYVYVEGEDMEGITTSTNYGFNNLEACTNYTFGVSSVSAAEDMSEPILGEGQTDVGPPPAPQNLQVDGYTSTTVTLTWDAPDTLCDVEEYVVKWTVDGIDTQRTTVTETFFTVTELSKNTTYTFIVAASTSYAEGPEVTVQQTTAEDDGGPPENLIAVGVSSSAINASWSPPAYEPEYYVVTAPPCFFLEEMVFGLSYTITGLDPCKSCSFSVTSFYSDTMQYTADTVGTTHSGDPPQPDDCSVEVTGNYITATWDRPESDCLLGPYSVKWTWTKLWGNGEEESNSVNTTGTKYNVVDLVPYSEYSFEVSASIDGVFGSPSSCSGTSLETLPGPPVILAVDSVQGEAVVTWETPAEENGVIVNYEIFVDEETNPRQTVAGDVHSTSVSLDACESFSLSVRARNGAGSGPQSEAEDVTVVDDVLPDEVDCAASDFLVTVCWSPYSPSCPVSQYNLMWEGNVLWSEDLEDSNSTTMDWNDTQICYDIAALPYTEYCVELTVGSGTDTRTCCDTTPMAAPGPPVDVDLAVEDLTINVTWTEPEVKNGIIDQYEVEWRNSTGIIGSKTTDSSTFSLTILGLSCGVTVDVTVSAKVENVAEFGEASSPQTAFLVNSVKTLECSSSVAGEVSLSWTLEDADCPISSYELAWTYVSLWSDDTGEGSEAVGIEENSFTVTPLPPYSSVSLQLHVDKNPEYTGCTATTREEASSPPTTVDQIANSTSSVTITWGLPELIRGVLTGWSLSWTTMNGDLIDSVTTAEDTMTCEITGLSSSSTYVVYVMAVNGAGEGEPGRVNATTIVVVEPSNTGLIIGLSVGGGVLLIVLLAAGFILYRNKNKPKPPRSAPHMPEVADADSDELYKMQQYSSVSQRFQDKIGSVDFGTNSELYTSPRPSLPKDAPDVNDDADNAGGDQLTSAEDRPQMFGAPPGRRFSQQVSTSLPRLGAYNRRPSQQVNSRMRNFEEYNRRPSQQDLDDKPSLSGGPPGKPNLGEYGRRPSQQIDVGRPNLRQYGRRPSQQVDLGRPNLKEYGRRPSQQVDLGKPRLGELGRRPSQQIDLGRPKLAEYGRRPSQQIDIGRPITGEYARRPSQQLPTGGGSYPSRLPTDGAPRRSSVDLYSRRPSQQADIGRPVDRMLMKRPSKQFVMSFEGIQEL